MPIPETPKTPNDFYSPHAGGDSIYAATNSAVTKQRPTRPPGAGAPYNGAFDDGKQNGSPMGPGELYQQQDRRPRPVEQYPPSLRPYSPPHQPSPTYTQGQPQHHSLSDSQFLPPATVLTAPDGSYCKFLGFVCGQLLTCRHSGR